MDNEKHAFLRREEVIHNLSTNALDRIIARGQGQEVRWQITRKPILPLTNSEAHIICSDVDVTTTNVAFGRWAIPKLRKELLSADPLTSKRAIVTLLDMVHDPEKAVEAIRLQVIPRLVRLMVSDDPFVRQRVLMILEVLAMQPGGKLAIVKSQTIMNNLTTLLTDQVSYVRLTAAKTVRALAAWYFGVKDLIKERFIGKIIHCLNKDQDDDIAMVLLEALEFLLDQDMAAKKQALDNEGIELAGLLEHDVSGVRAGAVAVLAQLVRHPDGKKAFLQHKDDLLATVTDLLENYDTAVRTHAAAVLMFVLCMTEAKLRCLTLQTPSYLLNCAQLFRQPALQVNAIKALTSLAEAPAGQDYLRSKLSIVQEIRPADDMIKRHKDILITVINRVI